MEILISFYTSSWLPYTLLNDLNPCENLWQRSETSVRENWCPATFRCAPGHTHLKSSVSLASSQGLHSYAKKVSFESDVTFSADTTRRCRNPGLEHTSLIITFSDKLNSGFSLPEINFHILPFLY
ncbi:hypothetical protein XENOCAPTIV_018108 [Xenoophorus captivus]|uniref:Uncharacterized protein n=1 Tax=Xenoophorus captivus TaxID=1517983 RepID=A0ABV0QDN8_9TELE